MPLRPYGRLPGVALKPGPLGYHRATSVSHAVQLLPGYEGTARVIAGGQSLVPLLNMRLIQPDALIDVNQLAGLTEVQTAGDATVLGALVRYTTIEQSPLIAGRVGLLGRMVRHVGNRQVRNRGTEVAARTGPIAILRPVPGAPPIPHFAPTACDLPPVELMHTAVPSPVTPLGVRGAGEVGCIPVAAAIGNAICDALAPFGVELDQLPITPERVWRAVRDSARASG